jgi:hypothetical protein
MEYLLEKCHSATLDSLLFIWCTRCLFVCSGWWWYISWPFRLRVYLSNFSDIFYPFICNLVVSSVRLYCKQDESLADFPHFSGNLKPFIFHVTPSRLTFYFRTHIRRSNADFHYHFWSLGHYKYNLLPPVLFMHRQNWYFPINCLQHRIENS